MNHFDGNVKGLTVGLWGLSFKPQTDDMREAPALIIIEKLLAHGCVVKAYDPVAMHETERRIGNRITYCKDQYEAAMDADAILAVE